MPSKVPPKIAKKKNLKVKYVIPDNLPDYHVSGVFGSANPEKLSMQFFSERAAIPKEYTATVDEKTKTVTHSGEKKGADFIRLIQTSIIMDLNTAIAVYNWMGEKIEMMANQQKALSEKLSNDESTEQS